MISLCYITLSAFYLLFALWRFKERKRIERPLQLSQRIATASGWQHEFRARADLFFGKEPLCINNSDRVAERQHARRVNYPMAGQRVWQQYDIGII